MKNLFYSLIVIPISFVSFLVTVRVVDLIVPGEDIYFGNYYRVIYSWPIAVFLLMYVTGLLLKVDMKVLKAAIISPLPALSTHLLTYSSLGNPLGVIFVFSLVIIFIWIVCEGIDRYTDHS